MLLLAAIVLLLSACKIRDANAGPDRLVKACKDTKMRFEKSYSQIKLPDHLRRENPVRLSSDFEIQPFLEGFEGIKVNENYKIDYVYQYRNLGGRPLLYALYGKGLAYRTEKEFESGKTVNFTNALETDGSAKGFLQLAMIDQLAPNFYLYFQGVKQDDVVLCNIDDIEKVLDNLDRMDNITKPNTIVVARALTMDNIEPSVTIDEKKHEVTTSFTTFTKWGGFYRTTLVFSTYFPHKLISTKKQLLIGYDCGIVF